MTSRNEVSEIRERFTGEMGDEAMGPAPARWVKVFGAFAALFVASIAAGLVLSGCGGSGDSGTRTETSAQLEGQETVTHAQVASAVAAPAPAPAGLSAEDMASRESLPPDLEVTVEDTLVVPGEVVDFVVEGTDDVSQIALSDGRDEPLPFVRDQGTNLWRVQYRVPLRPKQDRMGVSVTAKNELGRWRRVWVFLHIEQADSTEECQIPVDNPDQLADGK